MLCSADKMNYYTHNMQMATPHCVCDDVPEDCSSYRMTCYTHHKKMAAPHCVQVLSYYWTTQLHNYKFYHILYIMQESHVPRSFKKHLFKICIWKIAKAEK
jgi:hypothetical protein